MIRGLGRLSVTRVAGSRFHPDDVEMARDALRGVARARERFAERMSCVPGLLRHKGRQLGAVLSPDDLADLVQDVVAAVWSKLESYAGHSRLEMWVAQFCTLELFAFLRRKRRQARLFIQGDDSSPEPPESLSVIEADVEQLYLALDQLTPEEAAVVRLKHFAALTFEEIASQLGISSNTAKTRYYRGIARMRECLASHGTEVHP